MIFEVENALDPDVVVMNFLRIIADLPSAQPSNDVEFGYFSSTRKRLRMLKAAEYYIYSTVIGMKKAIKKGGFNALIELSALGQNTNVHCFSKSGFATAHFMYFKSGKKGFTSFSYTCFRYDGRYFHSKRGFWENVDRVFYGIRKKLGFGSYYLSDEGC